MRLFITDDLINTLECGHFGLFNSDDIGYIIDAVKSENEDGYIIADKFIGKILNDEYIYLQHIKYEVAGAIDMFYVLFGLEDDI